MSNERLHIVGGAGSGKTTLASQIAAARQIPHVELDNLYYENVAHRKRRAADSRNQMLSEIVDTPRWVVEGIFWQSWVMPAFEQADQIIVLDIPASTRSLRVVKRHLRLLGGAPPAAWPTFFPTLIELLKHSHRYANGPLKETLACVAAFGGKVVVCESNKAATQVLERL